MKKTFNVISILILFFTLFFLFSCQETPTSDWILINESDTSIEVILNTKKYTLLLKSQKVCSFDTNPVVELSDDLHIDYLFGSYYKNKSYNMIKFSPQPKYDYLIKNQTSLPLLIKNKNIKIAAIEPHSEFSLVIYKVKPTLSFINENFSYPYTENFADGIYNIVIFE